jgi:signal transduction histidine kinase
VPLTRSTINGRAILDRQTIHIHDARPRLDDEFPDARDMALRAGLRTTLSVPLTREGGAYGVIFLFRREVRPFSAAQVALVETFARQAAIAIDNVRLFREIEDKSRQLEIANQHKSAFLASMSHELRTPLNAIIGFSEVLLARYFGELNEKQDDYLKDIHASGRHLLSLINDVLDLSKVEAGRMELEVSRFDLPAALGDAMTLVRERAGKHGIALGLDVAPALGELAADERKFKQIVVNLLSNAVKFTPDGGRVIVRSRVLNDSVVLMIADTGIGIAQQSLLRLGQPFEQVESQMTKTYHGSGLGLAISKSLTNLHGGTMRLRSKLGVGTVVCVTLPRDGRKLAAEVSVAA